MIGEELRFRDRDVAACELCFFFRFEIDYGVEAFETETSDGVILEVLLLAREFLCRDWPLLVFNLDIDAVLLLIYDRSLEDGDVAE